MTIRRWKSIFYIYDNKWFCLHLYFQHLEKYPASKSCTKPFAFLIIEWMLCLSLMFANSIGYSNTTTKWDFILPPLSAALRKGFTEGLTSAPFFFHVSRSTDGYVKYIQRFLSPYFWHNNWRIIEIMGFRSSLTYFVK